ncbi:NAC domain-containing protein [Thamnidium elegans]|uniref:Nascent polypeptide-associated complex subunit alpha n=1 Tax=Thamnidium elegans TaxID=101142 RepID=A0A8H7SMA5_9FUNG|nr:hypothetical protein INT48_000637 [Thamnidium elegans]KAI8083726.1 NAC domain-containing protein [Thamnidium elegans]
MSDQVSPQSRGEQKARKALLALDLKPVKGVNRVTFTRGRATVYAIGKPDVFMSMNSDTYIVFGEMQAEDMAARAQQAALEQQLAQEAAKEEEANVGEGNIEEEKVDADGIDEEHITTVMSQASVTRSKAIEALKKSNDDVVNAIMELTLQ